MPDPPLQYKALHWSRDLGISYMEVLKLPMEFINMYYEMIEIEKEYSQPQIPVNPDNQDIMN